MDKYKVIPITCEIVSDVVAGVLIAGAVVGVAAAILIIWWLT